MTKADTNLDNPIEKNNNVENLDETNIFSAKKICLSNSKENNAVTNDVNISKKEDVQVMAENVVNNLNTENAKKEETKWDSFIIRVKGVLTTTENDKISESPIHYEVEVFYCKLCGVVLNDDTSIQLHLDSLTHCSNIGQVSNTVSLI